MYSYTCIWISLKFTYKSEDTKANLLYHSNRAKRSHSFSRRATSQALYFPGRKKISLATHRSSLWSAGIIKRRAETKQCIARLTNESGCNKTEKTRKKEKSTRRRRLNSVYKGRENRERAQKKEQRGARKRQRKQRVYI